MSVAPKNLAASVKARLQNEAARRGDDFNLLLLRYGIERLLFRLSQSAYADRFLLKGQCCSSSGTRRRIARRGTSICWALPPRRKRTSKSCLRWW